MMAKINYDERADITNTQETEAGKLKSSMDYLQPEMRELILTNFGEFKAYLGNKLKSAENIGFSDEQIVILAEKVANYLSAHEEPRNNEEKLLQELWQAGTQEERHQLARMMVNMIRS
jgi:hypothetical protein